MDEMAVTVPSYGASLQGTLFLPSSARPRAYALINGATGVPARVYASFARWLADMQGIACLTYDYRDFGRSGAVADSPATMTDWGIHDQQAARDWLSEKAEKSPLWVIGHSLGGMMLPYQLGLSSIDRVIVVAAGAVHVSDHPWPAQLAVRLFWTPGLTAISRRMGYFPGRLLRQGTDIPVGVYAQWRLWCTSKGFHRADPDLPAGAADGLACPMKVVAVSDDVLCPPATVWRLMQVYPEAHKRQLTLYPEDYGLRTIGHINVLTERSADVWPDIIA
ncbi:MAG: alpha/beta fold hydrolase [Pseudomonadota bacterium]